MLSNYHLQYVIANLNLKGFSFFTYSSCSFYFKALLLLLWFYIYILSYITTFVGMYCCNSNLLANLGNNYVRVSKHNVAELTMLCRCGRLAMKQDQKVFILSYLITEAFETTRFVLFQSC